MQPNLSRPSFAERFTASRAALPWSPKCGPSVSTSSTPSQNKRGKLRALFKLGDEVAPEGKGEDQGGRARGVNSRQLLGSLGYHRNALSG